MYLDVEQLGDVLLDGRSEPHLDVASRRRRSARGHVPPEHNLILLPPLSIVPSEGVGPIGDAPLLVWKKISV